MFSRDRVIISWGIVVVGGIVALCVAVLPQGYLCSGAILLFISPAIFIVTVNRLVRNKRAAASREQQLSQPSPRLQEPPPMSSQGNSTIKEVKPRYE